MTLTSANRIGTLACATPDVVPNEASVFGGGSGRRGHCLVPSL
jgi:hypothetical protein